MVWGEINFVEKTWTIPADRHKAGKKTGRTHVVALSTRALAILESAKALSDCNNPAAIVFPGGARTKKRAGQINENTFASLSQSISDKMGAGHITVHGFRSTFRDWAAETTNFPNEVVEMYLAHTVKDAVERAYRRGDLLEKRRELAEQWAKYIAAKPVKIEDGSNVVQLSASRIPA